jgi:hypothetical protein
MHGNIAIFPEVEEGITYDIDADEWGATAFKMPAGMHVLESRTGNSMIVHESRMYVVGQLTKTMHVFNLLTHKESTFPAKMRVGRAEFAVVAHRDRLYAVGGRGLCSIESLALPWSPYWMQALHPTVPPPFKEVVWILFLCQERMAKSGSTIFDEFLNDDMLMEVIGHLRVNAFSRRGGERKGEAMSSFQGD